MRGVPRAPTLSPHRVARPTPTVTRCFPPPAAVSIVANWWGTDALRTEISIPRERLDEFCRRWKIVELRVFGSALREDFRPDSDLDLLVKFAPDADWSLMDHVAMEEELAGIVGRKVDLVSQRAIERSSNWIRRKAILESAEPYFASR
jgi:predicted nucleotidyltransferase